MQKAVRIIFSVCTLLAALFILTPFLYAFGFCFPAGDDFDEITRSMFLFDLPGGLYEIGRAWLTWSGRYTYNFLAVFLAKTAESRIACGTVCAIVFLLNGAGAYLLARSLGISKGKAIYIGLFALLALTVFSQCLPANYLLTDSLTICLQNTAVLFYLYAVINLWNTGTRVKKPFAIALIIGIFGIGLYEHSALAIFWISLAALFLAVLTATDFHISAVPAVLRAAPANSRVKIFSRLAAWLGLALCFSFLAPGNFQRKQSRGVDLQIQLNQLANVWNDFCGALMSFMDSNAAPCAICLAVLVIACAPPGKHISDRRQEYALAIAGIAVFSLYALSIITVHALSDQPFKSQVKFSASSSYNAVLACVAALYPLFRDSAMLQKAKAGIVALAVFVLLALAGSSDNFRQTAINAASGRLLQAATFLQIRAEYLHGLASTELERPAEFGLTGEIRYPGSRRRSVNKDLPQATVERQFFGAFPTMNGLELAKTATGWPNLWAAWVYGLGSLRAIPPNYENVANIVRSGGATEMAVPEGLAKNGIKRAWQLVMAGENVTFANAWTVFELAAEVSDSISLLQPSKPQNGRLMPMWLQKKLQEQLLSAKEIRASFLNECAAVRYNPKYSGRRIDDLYIFVTGIAGANDIPGPIFASLDNRIYFKLQPYIN